MSPKESDSKGLSRRQILGFVGTAGTAGALSGAATGADLFDREWFADNSVTTGRFSLSLACERDSQNCSVDQRTVALSASELKPGNSGSETVSITVEDNDGWVWLRTACPEPSALAAKLNIRVLLDGQILKNADGEDAAGSLSTVQKQLADGARLTPNGANCFTAGESWDLEIEYELPGNIGSNLEDTETNVRFQFYAEQCRHNASPMNPFSEYSCEERCVACGDDDGNKIARATFEYEGPETTVELAQGSTSSNTQDGKRASKGESVLSERLSSGDTVTAEFHGETHYGPNIDFIAAEEPIACFHISCSEPFGPGLQIMGEHDENTYRLTVVSAEDTDGTPLCSVDASAKNRCNGG